MFRDLGVGARERARFIKRHNHRRRQKLGAKPVKMQFSPPGGSNHNTPLSCAVFPKCIYLSRPFFTQKHRNSQVSWAFVSRSHLFK